MLYSKLISFEIALVIHYEKISSRRNIQNSRTFLSIKLSIVNSEKRRKSMKIGGERNENGSVGVKKSTSI